MPKAIFVSLSRTFPQLAVRSQESDALRNCTCAWWQITPANATDVRYAFGVFEGCVVSAYRVDIDIKDWPIMPDNAIATGRRYIPVEHLTPGARSESTRAHPDSLGRTRASWPRRDRCDVRPRWRRLAVPRCWSSREHQGRLRLR